MRFIRITALLVLSSLPAFAEINVKNGKITATFTSQPLRQAVQTIEKQSGVRINVDESVADETVSANFKNLPLAVGIKKLLEGTGINYAVIAGADGIPSAVLISGSEKPGQPQKKLDTRPTSTPANYQNRSVVTPVNPTPPPQTPTITTNPPQPGTKEAKPVPPSASGGVNQSGGPAPNQQPPAINPTPKFDPNNIPTAGSLVPTTNPPPPQPNVGAVVAEDDDDDDDED